MTRRLANAFAVLAAAGCASTGPLDFSADVPRHVSAPRAWMEPSAALDMAARQAGLRYAMSARQAGGLVGPFAVGETLTVGALLGRVAAAAGMEVRWRDGVAVLEPELAADSRGDLGRALADIVSPDAGKRREAAYALGESQRTEALPALNGALGDRDRSVRRAALLALASFEGDFEHCQWAGRVSVFELAGARLDTDSLMWVAEEAAPAGGDEWKAAVSILARARDPQLPRAIWHGPWNRTGGTIMPAIRAVGRCGDPDVRAMLEKRLRETFTNNPADRYEAAASLGRLGMADSLRAHALAGDRGGQPPDVRAAAVYGLGFCRGRPAAVETLGAALSDTDARVREMAVFALGEMGTAEAGEVLGRLLADGKADACLRAAAARNSAGLGLPALARAAGDGDPSVRAAAAEALGRAGGTGAVGILGGMVRGDADRWVRAEAARALATLWPDAPGGTAPRWRNVLEGLSALLADPATDPEVRLAIAVGAGQGRAPEWAEPLAGIALDPAAPGRLRKYAARSLAMLANRAGQPALLRLLESEPPARMTDVPLRYLDFGSADLTVAFLAPWLTGGTPDEQVLAAERIGELGTAESVRLMVGAFDAFNNHTRWTQEWSLIRSGSPAAVRALVERLRSSRRSGVRMNAALALAGRRDPAAVDALVAATGDVNLKVRKAAANALGVCGDAAATPALIGLLEKDPDIGVAHEALRALRLREFASLPEAREALARVRGTARDCGVPGGPAVAEQAGNSWVLRRWQEDYDDATLPDLTYESALAYDAGRGRVVQWGSHGRRADTPQTGRTWLYDAAGNSWRRPTPRQEPPGVCITRGLTADPVRELVVSPSGVGGGHGWIMALRKHACYSVPWLFDCRSDQWFPAHPLFHPGNCTGATACFDARNDVMLLNDRPLVYDPHANFWVEAPRAGGVGPAREESAPGCYDPLTGHFVMVAGSDSGGRARTWAYDLAAGLWTDLAPADPPPASRCPMVYDSANDVMLMFRPEAGRTGVWVYHPRANRWEEMPASYPSPGYHQNDFAYDPVNNVAVLSGGWEFGQSGTVTIRETWTYRYRKPEAERASAAPGRLRLELVSAEGGGAARLTWEKPPAGAPGGYHVWRGAGPHPWTARFERLTQAPVREEKFPAAPAAGPGPSYFRVTAVGADGKEGPPSNLARTQPEAVREVFCARGADGRISVSWTPSRGPGVTGYNVYRAPCEPLDLWTRTFDPEKNDKKGNGLVKLTAQPVAGTSFSEAAPPGGVGTTSETAWAPLFVYVVKAVNLLGQESGASPATLSIPAAPGPVVALRLPDGRCLTVSGSSGPLAGAERGRWLYRMDSYKSDWAFRARGSPQAGAVLVDDGAWPVGDRRCYFVIAADGSGQLGIPGTEAWTLNAP